MRGRLVAGNWKSNGGLAANQQLLVSCAALPRLCRASRARCACLIRTCSRPSSCSRDRALTWGAQDVSQFGAGAFTGAVTAAMLRDFGCRYAIVGHSERRSHFGESNATVAAKFGAALQAGLTPIACVGETLQEREAGRWKHVVGAQIDALIGAAGVAALARSRGCLRAGVGHRHREDRDTGSGAGGACVYPAADCGARCGGGVGA